MDSKIEETSIAILYQWIQRVEQITKSIDSRLSAIEKRLSNNMYNDIDNDIPPMVTIRDDETISILQDTLALQQNKLEELREKIEHYSNKGSHLTMRIGEREVSLEITGIIGGIIAFLIAGLIMLGGRDIIISPIFLTIIGIIFISFSILKPFYNTPVFKKISSKIYKNIREQ